MRITTVQSDACQEVFSEVCRRLRGEEAPPVEVCFYPYVDLDHTIRLREGRLKVRLSDIAADAPPPVIEALAWILLSRIFRRRVPRQQAALYRAYSRSPEVRADSAHTRALRARPSPGHRKGTYIDLEALFDSLNRSYFDGRLNGITLLWSRKRALRRLGYYRRSFHTIVISRALDDPRVPGFVVEFILYHEMLHASLPSEVRNGRRCDHSAGFRAAERRFERYQEASRFLDRWPQPVKPRRGLSARLF